MTADPERGHRGIAFALTAAVVSGIAVFVNGLAVRRFDDATTYTTAKNLVAGSLLAAALLASTTRTPSGSTARTVPRRAWPALAVIALVGGAVPFVLFFEGLARATSTNAAFIHKTLVVWVAIGATVVLRERLSVVHVAAIGLLVAGHVVLTGGIRATGFGAAELLVLTATLLWAIEVIVVKRVLVEVPPTAAATARMAGGSVLLLGWLAVTGRLDALGALEARQWLWLLLTGSTLAAFVATWYTALALAPAIDVTAVLVLGAVVTGVLDGGFGDVAGTADGFGYVLITVAVAAVAGRAASGPAVARPVAQRASR
jgi:drug/metabolite transporter (DMT)-like permease